MSEENEYRGYKILILRHGPGWRALIYAPEYAFSFPYAPRSIEPNSHDDILRRAKKIVDRVIGC